MKTTIPVELIPGIHNLATTYVELRGAQSNTRYDKGGHCKVHVLGERRAWPIIDLRLHTRTKQAERVFVTTNGEFVERHLTSFLPWSTYRMLQLKLEQVPLDSLSRLAWRLREKIDEIQEETSFF